MLGRVKSILHRLRLTSSDGATDVQGRQTAVGDDATAEGQSTGSDAASSPQLYECPSCDRVYIAHDKQTCSTCETAVNRTDRTD